MDGTKAEELPLNEFATFDEFLTFVLIREIKHDSIKRRKGESKGDYETRINDAALKDLRENYKKMQFDLFGENKPVPVDQIDFQEESTSGYRNRTIKNASADATIAIAVDFNSAGEKLTKSAVQEQKKKYIPIDVNTLEVTDELVDKVISDLNSVNAKTLNIAGNGIYTMKGQYSQQQVDDFTYDLLKRVIESPKLKNKIVSIRSGGQTGFDEAGAKAGLKLGLPTIILAPKGWTFRNEFGKDIFDEKQFKNRFPKMSNNSGPAKNHSMSYVMPAKDNLTGKDTSTLALVESGLRTATTRSFPLGNVGDIISFENRDQKYRITNVERLNEINTKDPVWIKQWSQKEQWTEDYFKSILNKKNTVKVGRFQTSFEKVNPVQSTSIPSSTEVVTKQISDEEVTEAMSKCKI